MNLTSTEAERLLESRRKALGGSSRPGRGATAGTDTARELSEIDAALARIADGTYGSCEVCGGAIGRDRLRALPEVRRCVTCTGG